MLDAIIDQIGIDVDATLAKAIVSAAGEDAAFGLRPEFDVPEIATRNVLPQGQRIAMFYSQLEASQPASNAREAYEQLAATLNAVEDAHSGLEAVANPGKAYVGRMYPPMSDLMTVQVDGRILAVTRGQQIIFGADGSILIFSRKTGELVFSKAGG